MMTIPIQVEPDIVVTTVLTESNHNNARQIRHSYSFEHSLVLVEELNAEGLRIRYVEPKFYGCRINGGKVQILDKTQGWLIDNEATKKYIENEAEKELLK